MFLIEMRAVVMRFLQRPLHAFGGVGLVLLVPGFGILTWLAIEKLVFAHAIGGRPLLMLGVLMSLMGVLPCSKLASILSTLLSVDFAAPGMVPPCSAG